LTRKLEISVAFDSCDSEKILDHEHRNFVIHGDDDRTLHSRSNVDRMIPFPAVEPGTTGSRGRKGRPVGVPVGVPAERPLLKGYDVNNGNNGLDRLGPAAPGFHTIPGNRLKRRRFGSVSKNGLLTGGL